MKIYSSRRDDLIAERDAYDAETAKLKDLETDQEYQYHLAGKAIEDAIVNKTLSIIGRNSLDLQVYARSGWNSGYEITVQVNERSKSDESKALAWNWNVKLDPDGNVIKESGSWSGLKATTPEQLNDLKESVRVLEILNNADWTELVNTKVPAWRDYVDPENSEALRNRKASRPDYDTMIATADFEDAMESGSWIKLKGRPDTSYYRGSRIGDYWAKILKMSDKFVTCIISYDNGDGPWDKGQESAERIAKAKLLQHVVQPIETYPA